MQERVAVALHRAPPPDLPELVDLARTKGFARFAVGPKTAVGRRAGESWYRIQGDSITPLAPVGARVPIQRVADPKSLSRVLAAAVASGTVAIRWEGDRVIPLETAVAARQGRFSLWVVTERTAEAPAALGALEHGADLVFVEVRTADDVEHLSMHVGATSRAPLAWGEAELQRVHPSGPGERVLVDTTSMLTAAEGMLVGSAAGFLFHVRSEAEGSRFTRPRPFRVNAGALHSYALMGDGTTRYLSELGPGDQVLVAEPNGAGRAVRVGRVKIERRPLVMLVGAVDAEERTLFVQEAETVRLTEATGKSVASTALRPRQRLLGVALPRGRHLGEVVEETVIER